MSSEATFDRPGRRTRNMRGSARIIALLAMALLLAGCAGGITGINLEPSTALKCDPTSGICGIAEEDFGEFIVHGQGNCGKFGVKWGDGEEELHNGNFAATTSRSWLDVRHQYTRTYPSRLRAWPGPKIVHAYSALNCTGEAKVRVNVVTQGVDQAGNPTFHSSFRLALMQPVATACAAVPDMRPMRKGATVLITEFPVSSVNFGCLLGGCINGVNGNSGPTDAGFPFRHLRRHSLVLRIVGPTDTQLVQGSAATRFVVEQDGPLEFCVNDDVLADNTGGWGMSVAVDETTVP